ncbi:hypothetical protein NHX12_021853 [Muraenolepis orangiensis]|uniref:Major facilitator superfamily (MFS) profile domain-containing protein n=1 Tax=Muraenolepis orangiensis TaxID=630683 RepID=A0A9Q0EUB1_9TELE|nr:hypothetical protein NHX12_021853 [Muraenolepis orangiensis]
MVHYIRFGRRFLVLLNMCILLLFGVASAFSPNFFIYMALRFVVATAVAGISSNVFVLGVEWTCVSKRGLISLSALAFFSVGLMLMSGVAYYIRNWRILHLVFSSPLVLILLAVYWQSGVALNITSSRIGAIVAPLIWLLDTYHPAIPMVVYGTFPIIGGFLCFLLPETLNMELQDHTEQRSVHNMVV